jgi:hypothetical protein
MRGETVNRAIRARIAAMEATLDMSIIHSAWATLWLA